MSSPADILTRHFPGLEPDKLEQLAELESLFRDWNSRINLVSRKDMDQFTLHHLVHSLSLVHWVTFPDGSRVLDVGTGGGLPGIPLAICFPRVEFFLCDSITKKAKAVEDMVRQLRLPNVQVVNKRAEKLESRWDFILGRAVTSLPRFLGWIRGNIRQGGAADLPHGILYWKGSLYREELQSLSVDPFAVYPIQEKAIDPYFSEKFIIHLTRDEALAAALPEEPAG